MTNTSTNVPMSVEDMQMYLQDHYKIPIVLKMEGETTITCPFCMKQHSHDETGHCKAGCADEDRYNGIGLFISGRYFIPNYGYTICEYKEVDGVNELIIPDNLRR